MGSFIDLHGQTKTTVLQIVKQRLEQTQELLDSGAICPNVENGKDHIWKVIVGAGHHSQHGFSLLKFQVADWLESGATTATTGRYEHCADLDNGVFLIRLKK